MFRHILVATDGNKLADKAVKAAIALAKSSGAKITIFYAAPEYKTPYYAEGAFYDWPPVDEYKKSIAQLAVKLLGKAAKAAEEAQVPADTAYVLSDYPHQAIIDQACKVKSDLIVMASHGRRGVSALFLGSETQKVLALTKIPVLVVR